MESWGAFVPSSTIEQNYPLKENTWWKVGGPAEFYTEPSTLEDVEAALAWAKEKGLAVTILGGGTNVLISDEGVKGLVLCTKKFRGYEVNESDDEIEMVCWAGTPKSDLLKVFLQKQLSPAVFLTGLPGDVAGGVVMNAGVGEEKTPREFCEIVKWVEVYDYAASSPVIRRVSTKDISWEYRHSSGWQPGFITRVSVAWPNQPDPEVMSEVRKKNKHRLSTQPIHQPSGGSTFRNPPGHKAAKLIDDCGLKGFHIGGAMVSEKHANFIVNTGSATADDIKKVIDHVQKVVQEKTGVTLTPEVITL